LDEGNMRKKAAKVTKRFLGSLGGGEKKTSRKRRFTHHVPYGMVHLLPTGKAKRPPRWLASTQGGRFGRGVHRRTTGK